MTKIKLFKLIDESHEKCNISEDCYNLVDRYLRKLDQVYLPFYPYSSLFFLEFIKKILTFISIVFYFKELHDFKMELEADNRGITEMLERHSLELDQPSEANHKENRVPKKAVSSILFFHFSQRPLQFMTIILILKIHSSCKIFVQKLSIEVLNNGY